MSLVRERYERGPVIVLKAFGTSAPIWVKPLFCYSLIAPICVHLALISFCGLRHVVFRKKVIHGLGYQVLHALLGVLDLYQFERRSCLCAAAMQYQARKQAKHEYIANRRWDKWSVTLKNEIQDRQIQERAKLWDKHHRKIFLKNDELRVFYKIDDRMTAITRLKCKAADTNLLNILKRKRAERDLVREEALLENASQLSVPEISANVS
jgi:hypothetical protein